MRLFTKLPLAILILTVLSVGNGCVPPPKAETGNVTKAIQSETAPANATPSIEEYSYKIVATFPHDADAFTQGLFFYDGYLYEGTGLYGNSSLRKVELETGKVLQILSLGTQYFGEGITVFGNTIVQLTWQNHKGFVYEKSTFKLQREFYIETEGWGITTDGKHLIMSDGTSMLHILSPQTFEKIGDIFVKNNSIPLNNLNELEYVDGLIYANVWNSDNITIIDPSSGRVHGWVNLSGLLPAPRDGKPVDVLNGIAYDAVNDRLFVTGKYWPSLFEIMLVKKQ